MPITYPNSIKTDFDCLCAVYSLIEQMRLEHNRQGAIARSDWPRYKDRWYLYAQRPKHLGGNIFDQHFLPLLQEYEELRESIRLSNFTEDGWKRLSFNQKEAAYLDMYGNRFELRHQPTKARVEHLDRLKTVDLAALISKAPLDPTENFTTWTEADVGGFLTITASKVSWAAYPRNTEDHWVYYDYGVDHFDGDFEHLYETYTNALPSDALTHTWMMSQTLDNPQHQEAGTGSYFSNFWLSSGETYYLRECNAGSDYSDSSNTDAETLYYMKNKRDEAVGTYGTIYTYIYNDSGRTDLFDTLTKGLHSSKKDFRYLMVGASHGNDPAAESTGYLENLDIQEAAEGISIPIVMQQMNQFDGGSYL